MANLGVNQVGKVMSQDETEQEIRGEGCVPVANGRFISARVRKLRVLCS